ncbi:MAG: hypothetical protein AB7T22_13030, partial [Calditrichaceae bacterium]
MKRMLQSLMIVMIAVTISQATTYLKFWVNGVEAQSMVQGELYAWEFDVSVPGGVADFYLYLDLDQNQQLSENDLLLDQFLMQDGMVGNDGPGDSSAVNDGLVYAAFGPFGFAPTDYMMQVIDRNDQSSATAAFHIDPLAEPASVISGTLTKENITAPDNALANIMIGAEIQEGYLGFWSGLTDENGDYTINIPSDGFNETWDVSIFFERQTGGYIQPEDHLVLVNNIAMNNVDFYLQLPEAVVYGKVLDEFSHQQVFINDGGGLRNTTTGYEADFYISQGEYSVPAVFGPEQTSATFELYVWGEGGLIPDYLIPNTWNDDNYRFTVTKGDSMEKNIYVVPTDASVFVKITKDGGSPDQVFYIQASNDVVGFMRGYSESTGLGELRVRSQYDYNISINADSDWGTPLPDGYVIEGATMKLGSPGDTVRFNLISATNAIAGSVSFDEGDPTEYLDINSAFINIYNDSWTTVYHSFIKPDYTYRQGTADGTYSVSFEDNHGDYLGIPARYENVSVNSDTVENLNFILNYRNSNITVKLINAPAEALNYWHSIQTDGRYPNIYQTGANAGVDTTFNFRVCDGLWLIYPPYFGEQYEVSPAEYSVTVTEEPGNFYYEFEYTLTTGITDNQIIPETFYVGQNYPNPFNPETTIEFGTAGRGHVEITVFDI